LKFAREKKGVFIGETPNSASLKGLHKGGISSRMAGEKKLPRAFREEPLLVGGGRK